METTKACFIILYSIPVEREPMWDGNIITSSRSISKSVEREPIWDGNDYKLLVSAFVYVEREPMWDGNC